jgi:molecular chaperone DnaK
MLGQFDLVGIPPAPRGVPQIEVTFDIDANGIVNVSALDKATNKAQSIRIQASGGLSDTDIERMVKEAETHAATDKKRRELVEARNQAEALIHSTEKTVRELGDKVSESDRKAVEAALSELKSATGGEDPARITAKSEELAKAAMKLGEALYRQAGDGAQASGAGAGHAGGSSASDGVVDAEFEEVKDEEGKKRSA